MAGEAGSILSSGASGAAAGSAFGPWGTAIGGVIGVGAGLLSANSAKKATKARAKALEQQAQRRLQLGKLQADTIVGQGGMDQTSFAASALSSGTSRASLAQSGSLQEIANRAQYEARVALDDANYEAELIRQDASAINQNAKANDTAAYFDAAQSILGIYGNYSNKTNAAKSANERSRQQNLATDLGTSTRNYRRPF